MDKIPQASSVRRCLIQRRLRLSATLRGGLVTTIVAITMLGPCAENSSQWRAFSQEKRPLGVTIVRGRVTNEKGEPLANAEVWLPREPVKTKSDAQGKFRVTLPGITQPRAIFIVAAKTASDPRAKGLTGAGRWIQVVPGAVTDADLTLNSPLYLAGTVRDEHGLPISGVSIHADTTSPNNSIGARASTTTWSDGAFELVKYSLKARLVEDVDGPKRALTFSHPDYVEVAICDPYSLTPGQRQALRIVLKTGHRVTGKVLDAEGKPVPNLTIRATAGAMTRRKAVDTDEHGQFALQGLPDGPSVITTVDVRIKQNARTALTLSGDQKDLTIRLQPMRIASNLKTYTVLGMSLTDVTRELRTAYDLPNQAGAFVIDPGKSSDHVSHHVAEGYVFSAVGDKRVRSVREFVAQILASATGDD